MNPEKENADPVSDRQEAGTSQMSETPRAPVVEDFKLLKAISRGAFGKVFLGCKKQKPDKLYAIKVMKKSDLINKNLIAQATTERDALAMIHSPFVVEIYYSLQTQHNIFLVMEYLAGGDVKSLLAVYGYLEENMAVMYMAEVTLALEHLHHKGIIHRDLKPDNMLISGNGHIKLTDFGLSKVSLDLNTTPCSARQMTPLSVVDQFRTPGQIMSLRSCLTFSADRGSDKRLDTAVIRDSKSRKALLASPLPPSSLWGSTLCGASSPHPSTASSTSIQPLPGIAGLCQPSLPSGLVSRSPKRGGTPVASLTPTLEQRGRWRHSSTMDSCGSGGQHDSSGQYQHDDSSSSLLGAVDLSHIHHHPHHHPHHHHNSSVSSSGDVFSSTRLHEDLSGCDDQPHTTPVSYRSGLRTAHRSLSARSLRSFREGSSLALAEEKQQEEEEVDLWGLGSSSVGSSFESPLLPYHGTRLYSLPEDSEAGGPQGCRESLSTKDTDPLSENNKDGPQDVKKPLPEDTQDSPQDEKDSEPTEDTEDCLQGIEGLPKGIKNSSPKDTENAQQDSKDSLPTDSTHSPQRTKDSVPEVREDGHHQGTKESLPRDREDDQQGRSRGSREDVADDVKDPVSGVRPSAAQELGWSVDNDTRGSSAIDKKPHQDSLSDTNQANTSVIKQGGSPLERQKMDRHQAVSFADRQQANPSPQGVVSFLAKSEALRSAGVSRKRSYESLAMETTDPTDVASDTDSPKRPHIPKRPPNFSTGLTQEVLLLQLGTSTSPRPPPSADPDSQDAHQRRVSTSPIVRPRGTSADPGCVSLASGLQCDSTSAGGFSALASASSSVSCVATQVENADSQPDSEGTDQQPPPHLSVSQQEAWTHKKAAGSQSLNEEIDVSFLSVTGETEETNQPLNQAVIQLVSEQTAQEKPASARSLNEENPDVSFLSVTEETDQHPDQSGFDTHTLSEESGGEGTEAMDVCAEDGCDGAVPSVQDSSLMSVATVVDGGGGDSGDGDDDGGGGGGNSGGGDVAVQDSSPEVPVSTTTHKTSTCLPLRKTVDFDTEHTIRQLGQSQSAGDWTSSHSGLSTPDRHHSMGSNLSNYHTPQRRPLSLCQLHRTPMEGVRRGPEPKPQEQERILGTPDYLAPEILRQETHGPGVDWWALGVCLFEMLTGLPPFNDETPELVFRNIMDRAISWPPGEGELGRDAVTAIDSLLTMNPVDRPGASDVKQMALFSSVDWDRLLETPPAFVPQLDDVTDTSYFEPKNTMQQLTISAVDM